MNKRKQFYQPIRPLLGRGKEVKGLIFIDKNIIDDLVERQVLKVTVNYFGKKSYLLKLPTSKMGLVP